MLNVFAGGFGLESIERYEYAEFQFAQANPPIKS
jgi:hypothetical protein